MSASEIAQESPRMTESGSQPHRRKQLNGNRIIQHLAYRTVMRLTVFRAKKSKCQALETTVVQSEVD
nr:unnamed protein product [Spirometra erinaceieuropaei]